MKAVTFESGTTAPLLATLAAACLAPACASVTGTPLESITIQTRDRSGNEVTGAACELSNAKGKWLLTSPGSVTITRSNDNMLITCRKDGQDDGVVALVSSTKGAMFGNILLGGGIGAIIDHDSGAAYEYPQLVQVEMGATHVIKPADDRPADSAPAAK